MVLLAAGQSELMFGRDAALNEVDAADVACVVVEVTTCVSDCESMPVVIAGLDPPIDADVADAPLQWQLERCCSANCARDKNHKP